jgi:ankyrin repeat protein
MGFLQRIPRQTDLFRFIIDKDWKAARHQLKFHPKDARQWAVIHVDVDIASEMLPLHQACRTYAPLDLIIRLLEAYPKAALKKDPHFQRFPLAFACQHAPYPELIQTLIDHNREAVFAVDKLGRLPLHYAAFGGAFEYIFHSLLRIHPKAAHHQDAASWLPLHIAVRYKCAYGVLEKLVKTYPQSLNVKTRMRGYTPATIAQYFRLNLEGNSMELLDTPYGGLNVSSSKYADYPTPILVRIDAEPA